MKIRYYLRGLGLGILFTAVFFLLGNNSNKTMSDEMIKERAKELGMVESTVLTQMNTTTEATEQASNNSVMETEIAQSEEVVETESVMDETLSQEDTTEEATEETVETETETLSEETTEEIEQEREWITFVVNSGEGSGTVSQRLLEMGFIEDSHAFDKYMMENGFDRRITAGEHSIPADATWEEISEIICRK